MDVVSIFLAPENQEVLKKTENTRLLTEVMQVVRPDVEPVYEISFFDRVELEDNYTLERLDQVINSFKGVNSDELKDLIKKIKDFKGNAAGEFNAYNDGSLQTMKKKHEEFIEFLLKPENMNLIKKHDFLMDHTPVIKEAVLYERLNNAIAMLDEVNEMDLQGLTLELKQIKNELINDGIQLVQKDVSVFKKRALALLEKPENVKALAKHHRLGNKIKNVLLGVVTFGITAIVSRFSKDHARRHFGFFHSKPLQKISKTYKAMKKGAAADDGREEKAPGPNQNNN